MLEVLGAAALLAFVYIALTRSEIEGLRSEQEANRRLQASLLADARLAELELAVAAGTPPPLGTTEDAREEPFRVRVDVSAFVPPAPPADLPGSGAPKGSLAARRAARLADPRAPSLFAEPRRGADPPLRAIEVSVRWDEGVYEREVRRTTFAFDPVVADAIVSSVQSANAASGNNASDQSASQKAKAAQDQAQKQTPPPTPKQSQTTGFGASDGIQ